MRHRLNISTFFSNGTLNFAAQDYQGTGNTNYLDASVINQGTIATDALGSVFLIGPNVTNTNTGIIKTQAGQIGLVAGSNVTLTQNAKSNVMIVDDESPADTQNAINSGKLVRKYRTDRHVRLRRTPERQCQRNSVAHL